MEPIILPHGGYQKLESYQNSIIIFDATNDFCTRFLKKDDRTVDQMIQAARSGNQNIVEGCEVSGISTETENCLASPAPAWRNCSKTTAIICERMRSPCGKKMISACWRSAVWQN